MAFNTDIEDPLQRIKDSCDQFSTDKSYFDGQLMDVLRPHSATLENPSRCTATFLMTVPLSLCNRTHNLHGGAAASLFDMATSLAIGPLSRGGVGEGSKDAAPFWPIAGVTRSLNCTYLRPVPEGMTIAIVCTVLGISKRLASVRGEIWEWDEEQGQIKGEMLVVCEHGKVNTMPGARTPPKL